MRIQAVQLSWFRGAADAVSLEPNCKSMVVYGLNGSGKSSFVDAIEYLLNNGRIGHLTHEYSGKKQEKAIPNTHKPKAEKTLIRIKYGDASEHVATIESDGTCKHSGSGISVMEGWDYRRSILRQDEVATFIRGTKGEKYSALLPLLGLHHLELAAENLRQLARAIETQSKLKETRASLSHIEAARKAAFGSEDDDQIAAIVAGLYDRYMGHSDTKVFDVLNQCAELKQAIATKFSESSTDQKQYVTLREASQVELKSHIDTVRSQNSALSESVDPLINERLELLTAAKSFSSALDDGKTIDCPACGRSIPAKDLKNHIGHEHQRLHAIAETFRARKLTVARLCDGLKSLKTLLAKAEVVPWLTSQTAQGVEESVAYLNKLDPEGLRTSCPEEQLAGIEAKILPLIALLTQTSHSPPPGAEELSNNRQTIEAATAVFVAKVVIAEMERAAALMAFISSLERGMRAEIRSRAKDVISEISADIQRMWSILHPSQAIQDVKLYVPVDAEKAIDIGLKFHGVEQDSPRLTLSEGYRNSLGLCIFLAMAKREDQKDRPVLLDDVVVSLDRQYRGMIVDVLQREFKNRQVIALTHDREWYTDLRQQLDGSKWDFKALLPYDTPTTGIRWAIRSSTFDDARAQLADRPDSAGNDARKIMDQELAPIAERLQLRMPYLRAEKNDRRTANDFLGRLISEGKRCFQQKIGESEFKLFEDGVAKLEEASRLLVSWGNRGSHSFDVTSAEASKLINACERARESFTCASCGKAVWFADAETSEWMQCQCGALRWRYGKG